MDVDGTLFKLFFFEISLIFLVKLKVDKVIIFKNALNNLKVLPDVRKGKMQIL